tara:strand:- start:118 stop:294 length:177 start_codon:yes stop_codon:yes gene_type:complete
MGYCTTCNEWCGYSTSFCELKECELTRKLIGLYGIKQIGETLEKPEKKQYNLRAKNEA